MHFRSFAPALALVLLTGLEQTRADVASYDTSINADVGLALTPLVRLTSAVVFTGGNRAAFNFGTGSGDMTIEFVVEGNPTAIASGGYLAVGANTSSNLRYEQWNNTGQLGFTQLGVADYLFSPIVPSPTQPTHLAFVWVAGTRTMRLYWNGSLAGSSSGVSASFAMPSGQGWLGANPTGGEAMVGTVHRVTVYDDVIPDAALQRHADAFNDIRRPPILIGFTATPATLFAPASATLSWNVQEALAVFVNGLDVTAQSSLMVSPAVTTTYALVATNAGGSVTGLVTVAVNPAPVIDQFNASRGYAPAGQTVVLSWNVRYGDRFFLAPNFGEVTAQTLDGQGSLDVTIAQTTTFTLAATSAFGTNSATRTVVLIQPAGHPVISEFKAESNSAPADEDGTFSDWIEIQNPTPGPVNLSGYYLTDEESNPRKWAFPNLDLAGGAHLLVFASGKNRVDPTAPLHTNFELDKAGEYLALIGPGPLIVQAFDPFPAQQDNASYGLLGGDPATARFLGVPTPGAANNDTPAPPARVRFSRPSGTFVQTFPLSLASDTPGAVIRYSTNGSRPTATNGLLYSGPIAVAGTLRVRAAAFGFGLASEVTGASFIKLGSDLTNYASTLPMMVIENFGAGVIPQKGWSGTGAGIKQVPRQDAVWATFDRVGGVSALTNVPQMLTTAGVRGRGAFSSSWRQKPYSVEATDEMGGERAVSPLELPAHADWVLYFPDPDSNKDPSLLFNTFAYELYRNSGHNGVRFRWVEAFVNEDGGELRLADRRGVYAIVEKVSRGQDRLDFQRLSEDGTNGTWLLNINRMDPEPETSWPAPNGAVQPWFFHTAGPNRVLQSPANTKPAGTDDEPQQSNGYLNFDNPTGYSINPNQRAAIENWFKQFEDVLWNNALWRDPVNGYRKYLDPIDFADYFILHTLTRNGDGLLISMFPWKGDDGKLRMGPAWDYNWSAYYISGAATGTLWHRPDRLWYKRLFADADFYQLYIDRWWDHRRGAMSNAGMDAIIDGQMLDISPAKAVLNGIPSASDWTNRLATMKTWLKDRANWIDSNFLRPPTFNQDGGPVPDGFQVTLFSTNGTIYFTTSGADPRAPGGAVAPTAQGFQVPITLGAQTLVQARIKNGTNWSGLTAAVFYPPQDLTRLALTEIMFNPPGFGAFSGDEVEFIELKNTGATALQLGTLAFTSGIAFTFTNGTQLGPGQFFVLARNPAVFASKYPGVPVNGVYSGRLDNSGETIRLSSPVGGTVLSVTYNDRAPWPIAADGHGFSVVPRTTLAVNADAGAQWRASHLPGGSPGADDPELTLPGLLINEILSHTDPPAVDWIELFNPTGSEVNLGGWFLSDDGAAPMKFRIPVGTTIPAFGFRVLAEEDFNAVPGSPFSFSIDSAGDSVYLSSGDANTNLTGYSHGCVLGAAANAVSFGRYVNSVGEEQFPAQLTISPGAANAGPSVGPVVLDEIMYHPAPDGDEFIELRNRTAVEIALFDVLRPTNTWRLNGLGYVFPTNLTIPAGARLLLVATNPVVFRARHGVPAGIPIVGPFAGNLQDSGERLELQRPDEPGTNGTPYVTVDAVRYNDKLPWPPAADGSGASLQRRLASAYGDDPINWEAAVPTPGGEFVPGQPPVITAQPQDQSVVSPGSAQFSASATGAAPLYFQWLFNSDPIPGATNALLPLTNIQPWQAGNYSMVAFNNAGSAASSAARLTVNRAPTILTQPTNQYVRPGFNAVFSVNAVGNGPLRYQWRFHGSNLFEATNATLLLTNVQLSNDGPYHAVVLDNIGPVISEPASLVVLIDPLVVEHPISQSVVPGGAVTLSATVTNTATLPVGFRLRRNSTQLTETFVTLNERTVYFTLHPTNVQPPWTNYTIVATNRSTPSGRVSLPAFLTYVIDTDGDGLPDEWEIAHGFPTNNAAEAALDADGDGLSNGQEYIAGTDPNDAASYLKVDAIVVQPGAALIFGTIAARTYTVQYAEAVGGPWSRLLDLPARPTNFTGVVFDSAWTTNRFYRLATPQRP